MVKNVVDVVIGGFTYWLFGYGLSYGESSWSNPFFGWGNFAFHPTDQEGAAYTTFFFQLSFATTATTVVSGAIAERYQSHHDFVYVCIFGYGIGISIYGYDLYYSIAH